MLCWACRLPYSAPDGLRWYSRPDCCYADPEWEKDMFFHQRSIILLSCFSLLRKKENNSQITTAENSLPLVNTIYRAGFTQRHTLKEQGPTWKHGWSNERQLCSIKYSLLTTGHEKWSHTRFWDYWEITRKAGYRWISVQLRKKG